MSRVRIHGTTRVLHGEISVRSSASDSFVQIIIPCKDHAESTSVQKHIEEMWKE